MVDHPSCVHKKNSLASSSHGTLHEVILQITRYWTNGLRGLEQGPHWPSEGEGVLNKGPLVFGGRGFMTTARHEGKGGRMI